FQSNAFHAVARAMARFVFGQKPFSALEHMSDVAYIILRKIQHGSFDRFEELVVRFVALVKNGGFADHELETFTAHLFDQDRELKLASAKKPEIIGSARLFEAKSNVLTNFADQSIAEFTRLNGFALFARKRGSVDRENHAQSRHFDGDARK